MNFSMRSRGTRAIVALVVIVVYGGWMLYRDYTVRNSSWQGTVSQLYSKEPLIKRPTSSNSRYRTKYYWRVTTAEGKTVDARVGSKAMWEKAEAGTPVFKRSGQMYPELQPAAP